VNLNNLSGITHYTDHTRGRPPVPRAMTGKVDTSMPKSIEDEKSCQNLLKECEMFHLLSGGQIETLATNMNVRSLHRNQTFVHQGKNVTAFYLVNDDEIHREFLDPDTGQRHSVEFEIKTPSINTMRILSGDPAQNSVKCKRSTCNIFEMPRQRLLTCLNERSDIGIGIANSLSSHVRETSKKYRTPLLEQRQQIIQNMPAVMIAAGIESYYRSALNSKINQALTGVKSEMFPNMHIQVPMRIAYIAGFKGLRAIMDRYNDGEEEDGGGGGGNDSPIIEDDNRLQSTSATHQNDAINRNFWRRLGITIAPGVIMTPLSSILEASNAGHLNKEPMAIRSTRGVVARCGREVIFGLGLNQLSDYFQERWQFGDSPMISNMIGSMMAGVVSGYFSHVPHILSTYKLIEPHRSYADLYQNVFVERSVPPFLERYLTQQAKSTTHSNVVANYSGTQQAIRFIAATIFPRGLVVRTTQIVGSFIILNGTINYFTLIQQQQQ